MAFKAPYITIWKKSMEQKTRRYGIIELQMERTAGSEVNSIGIWVRNSMYTTKTDRFI